MQCVLCKHQPLELWDFSKPVRSNPKNKVVNTRSSLAWHGPLAGEASAPGESEPLPELGLMGWVDLPTWTVQINRGLSLTIFEGPLLGSELIH